MRTYSIGDLVLNADAYTNAIVNVINELNAELGTDLTYRRDMYTVDRLIESLNIRFDENGRIVTSALEA